MSKALSFRAKSKMLGQDSVPFKNGYVISPSKLQASKGMIQEEENSMQMAGLAM